MKHLILSVLFVFFGIAITNAQSRIPASSASQYMGQFKKVYGYIYKGKIVKRNGQKHSVSQLIYLSDSTLKVPTFIIVNNVELYGSLQAPGPISHKLLLKEKPPLPVEAIGKIIMYKGKPAIVVDNPENYIIYQKVD